MGNVPWCVTVLCAAFFLLAGPAHADDICSEAAGGECEAAQEIVDMAVSYTHLTLPTKRIV